jgi:thiol-disulfide isomerase/thioredoxin
MTHRLAFGLALFAILAAAPTRLGAAEPDIRVVDLAGLDAALRAQRGHAVLLTFWAIWCEPCVEELPGLLEVGRDFRDRGGVVLTVSYDLMVPGATRPEVLRQMREFVAARQVDAPVLIYDGPDYDAINARLGLPGIVPATLVIDRAGTILERHVGRADKAHFTAMMLRALN